MLKLIGSRGSWGDSTKFEDPISTAQNSPKKLKLAPIHRGMSFTTRNTLAKKHEEKFYQWMASQGAELQRTGYEYQCEKISDYPHYVPDFYWRKKRIFYEIKAAAWGMENIAIEREAWSFYQQVSQKFKVWLVLVSGVGEYFAIKPEKVVFLPGDVIADPYTPTDGVWRCPRRRPDYARWKRNHPQASGTDYALIHLADLPAQRLPI